ncbi:MAG: type I restriction-modification system subunit M [Nitrosopumilaceae archaeon]|nr:type I restriction-modification system subunit M [Nitrosopumilaceae archaeon]
MAIKKSELYSKLWKSCDELRGGMDASEYKDYILVLLFVKYVSDKYTCKKGLIEIPKKGSFQDMVALVGKPEIGEEMNKIIAKLAEANGLKGIIDNADFNDDAKLGKGKAMEDRLSNLVGIFDDEQLDFSKNRAEGDDLLGDAYEYLMRNFATQSGKSKGQFYTPSEVSQVIAKIIGTWKVNRRGQTVYDPTCGSGSLLLKVAHEAPSGVTIYGQEKEGATRAMAKMNMVLHENEDAKIESADTISDPLFLEGEKLKEFDFAVANPPFSTKAWSSGIKPDDDKYKRFDGFDIPPAKNGDYAFLLHLIKSLKRTGKGAIILPHGVLFRGNVEATIRKNIISRGYIKGIIGLPPNLFYGTGIPACIIVIDKENAEGRKGIFLIDASKGFIKDGNKNRLQARDIHKIVDVFTNQIEIPKYSRMVALSEISDDKNEYNLNIPRYIDSQEEEDIQDIEAHLQGDIPKKDIDDLDKYWEVYPNIRQTLFSPSKRKNYESLKVDSLEIKTTIFEHEEFKKYSEKINKTYSEWEKENLSSLTGIKIGVNPKKLISDISESILDKFSKLKLIDKYDIYQHLMTYWEDIMQDDLYLLSQNGWNTEIIPIKDKNGKEKGWDSELIPKNIVIDKYFAKQNDELTDLQSELENVLQEIQTIEEENQGEDDLLEEAKSDAGNVTDKIIKTRIKAIKDDSEHAEELKVLTEYKKIMDDEKELKKQIKTIETELDKNLFKKYNDLDESEIKELVIHDKWLTSIHALIDEEMEQISHKLARRINELAERYETPLPDLTKEVKTLTKKVDEHLEKMGFKW